MISSSQLHRSHRDRTHDWSLQSTFSSTHKTAKKIVTSPLGQGIIGFGLGVGMHKITNPLTIKTLKVLKAEALLNQPDPFRTLGFKTKVAISPFVSILIPLIEEQSFRGDIQNYFKKKFKSHYRNHGFSNSSAKITASCTSILVTSLIFGAAHFTNALVFWCHPKRFLIQVIATTFMGVLFGTAKELSGGLAMPNGMHIGNNTLACYHFLRA